MALTEKTMPGQGNRDEYGSIRVRKIGVAVIEVTFDGATMPMLAGREPVLGLADFMQATDKNSELSER